MKKTSSINFMKINLYVNCNYTFTHLFSFLIFGFKTQYSSPPRIWNIWTQPPIFYEFNDQYIDLIVKKLNSHIKTKCKMVPTHVHNTHGFEQEGYLLVALCPITFRLGAILLQFKNDTGSFHTKKKRKKKNDTRTATSKY